MICHPNSTLASLYCPPVLPHYFHYTHQGIASLFQDRGFQVLEVGYDLCFHKMKNSNHEQRNSTGAFAGPMPNEQVEENWLVYIVAQKL